MYPHPYPYPAPAPFSAPPVPYPVHSPMAMANIQGQPLELTVIGCNGLRDTEWLSRQDPYVCLEYGNTKYRTKTCTDGGKNPTFNEKFVFPLIQGLSDMNVLVWNSNTLSGDDFIGRGGIQLNKVLTQGYDDTPCPLWTRSGKRAGEVRIIMRYANNQPSTTYVYNTGPSAYAPPLYQQNYPPAPTAYPPPSGYPPGYQSYPPPPSQPYPPPSYPSYPPPGGYYPPPY